MQMLRKYWNTVTRAQVGAFVAAVATIVLGVVIPALYYDAVQYDAMTAVTIVMTIAIAFTAAYAADSVSAFREARDAEYTPVLDVRLSEKVIRGSEVRLALEVRNVGRGIAAGVECAIWWMEGDLVAWVPHRIDLETDLLRPGDATTGEISRPTVRAAVQRYLRPGVPELVVEVRCRNALRSETREFTTYDTKRESDGREMFRESIHPVPAELTSLSAKQSLLDGVLAEMADQHGLEGRGFELSGKVDPRMIQVRLTRDGEDMWWGQTGVERPVYDFAESLNYDLPAILARHETNSGGPPKQRNEVEDPDAAPN